MLVITRKVAETVVIDDCEVTIVEIRPDKVRLGIEAPKDVSIHREEVYQAIQRERHDHEPQDTQ